MIARRLIIIVVSLLLTVQVVRNAAVTELSPLRPTAAAKVWRSHPSVEISLGLANIGKAARERRSIDAGTFKMIDDAAIKSPLSAEPFLVRGVQAENTGDLQSAEGAFLAAQWRDPRSLPAAYFLADYYFRHQQNLRGLRQAALLAKLSPNGVNSVAPFVAVYAQSRSNWPQIRALFRSNQDLEDGVLAALARDPGNVDAILAVADANHRRPNSAWLPVLLDSLVNSGDYGRARAIWSSIGGARVNGLLYDSDFSASQAPPPFNWTFASTSIGLAERQAGKRLHVIFYGDEDGPLASQLVLLPPGTYRLQMQVIGSPAHAEQLNWSVRCAGSTDPFASVGLADAVRGWTFQVPADCQAQWLQLNGRSGDVAQQSDVTIGPISLTRVGPNA